MCGLVGVGLAGWSRCVLARVFGLARIDVALLESVWLGCGWSRYDVVTVLDGRV